LIVFQKSGQTPVLNAKNVPVEHPVHLVLR
jgi:hypothetical protein